MSNPICGKYKFSKEEILKFKALLAKTSKNLFYDQILQGATLQTADATKWDNSEMDPNAAGAQLTPGTLFSPIVAPTSAGAATNKDYNRKGDLVEVYSITIRGMIYISTSNNRDPTTTGLCDPMLCRLILYQDTQTNHLQSQAEDVMNGSLLTTAKNSAALGFRKVTGFDRYRILRDKIIEMQNPIIAFDHANTTKIYCQGKVKSFELYKCFPYPVKVTFGGANSASTESVTSLVTNSFHLIGISNYINATAATNNTNVKISYVVRTWFKDVD